MKGFSDKLLTVQGVSRSFPDNGGERLVLDRVSVDLSLRDSLAVIGPSGCGKTTLLLMLAGLIPCDSGRILLKGEPVRAPRRETALVLQDYGLFPWKTVRQNIELGVRLRRTRTAKETVESLERELGISGLGEMYPQQLSGGQRQRVALARAFILRPELLLLDEPFAALDAMTRERLQNTLLALFAQRAFSFVIVTHNIEEAVTLGRRVMVLAGQPTRVAGMLDNPTFGMRDQRIRDEFFAATVQLRRLLEEAQ